MTEMPTVDPPKSWELITGTWGTDAQRDNDARFGAYSLKLKSTAVASKLRSGFRPVENGARYMFAVHAKTDDNTAGYYLVVTVEKYTATDKETPFGTNTYNFDLTATSTWEWVEANWLCSHTGFVRVTVGKTTNANNIWVDRVVAEMAPALLDVVSAAATQAITTGTWTTVQMGPTVDRGFVLSSYTYICNVPGFYHLSGLATFDTVSDGTIVSIRIKHAVAGAGSVYYYGDRVAAAASMTISINAISQMTYIGNQDVISLEVWHNEGSDVDLIDDDANTGGARLQAMRSGRI